MRHPFTVVLFHLLFFLPLLSSAAGPPGLAVRVYRCQAADGRIEFRQSRCHTGEEVVLQVRNHTSGWVRPLLSPRSHPARPGPGEDPPADGDGHAAPGAVAVRRCRQASRRLERIRRRLRGGYRAGESGPLHRQQREQAGLIRRYCH